MGVTKFGFSDSAARNMDLNTPVPSAVEDIFAKEPSLRNCISCGNCGAMCTTGQFVDLRFYRLVLLLRRGVVNEVKLKARNCMLCGKCQLTCPRGVNIRHAVLLMNEL